VTATGDAVEWICRFADGDARRALTALENAALQAGDGGEITTALLEELYARKVLLYDKSGEEHFNIISALHKSLRDSDVDAGLYWLARMLEAGEEPLYVARRLVRFASEDVGLADAESLRLALLGRDAVHFLGMPEGALALAQVVVHLALAPKSNAIYVAYKEAAADVRERPNEPPPLSIRNAPTRLMKETGYGAGYVYAHDTAEKTAGLGCLPEALAGRRYYRPSGEGQEKALKERVDAIRKLRAELAAKRDEPQARDAILPR
jgi:putative ATPase